MNAPSLLAPAQSAQEQIQALLNAHKYREAEEAVRPLLVNGGPLDLWRMLVNALRKQGRSREARDIQMMLVDNRPGDYSLRFDLSETLLLLGEFDRGWREYHYRYSLPHTTRIERKVQMPRWDGRLIPGKTLLIHDEQGYGDILQFMRMVAWAKEKSGADIVLQTDRDVLPFAQRMKAVERIIPREALPPQFDFHCEMMSLPMAMGLKLTDLPGKVPYTTAEPARLKHWKKRLADLPRPLVALVWAGRPTHPNDANRSMPFAELAALAMPGVTFLSVQKGPASAEANTPPAGMNMVNLSDEIKDFEDTGAILAVADLLISIDSSPVHLAGALGRPAWVLLPFFPDWRWLEAREDTPWYPTVKLFRQSSWGDWGALMKRVAESLAELRTGHTE